VKFNTYRSRTNAEIDWELFGPFLALLAGALVSVGAVKWYFLGRLRSPIFVLLGVLLVLLVGRLTGFLDSAMKTIILTFAGAVAGSVAGYDRRSLRERIHYPEVQLYIVRGWCLDDTFFGGRSRVR